MANSVEAPKVGEYVVEGAPAGALVATKVGVYVVEGPPDIPPPIPVTGNVVFCISM